MAINKQFTPSETAVPILESSFVVEAAAAKLVELELSEPMVMSFGEYTSRPSGWLALDCRVGAVSVVGYGEGATLPQAVFTDDSGSNIVDNLQELTWLLATPDQTVGDALDNIQSHTFADGKRYPTARLAAEMAVLDAATKAHSISVKEMIGIAPEIVDVPYGKSIGGSSAVTIVRQAEEALSQSARKIKIKISPSMFSEVMLAINTIRCDYPDIESIMVDANGAFDPHDSEHLAMLTQLDNAGLIMIEEPVSRVGASRGLEAVRHLRQKLPNLKTPICLDDCLRTIEDCRVALDEGLANIINVKPGRIGSFILSLDLVELATECQAQVMVGGMLEGTPGRCMTTLLGAYCIDRGFVIPGDLSLAQDRLATDLVQSSKQLRLSPRGAIALPNGPGWGF